MDRGINSFEQKFGCRPRYFYEAPGRTEICGNHTDHQNGCVLAAAVNITAKAWVTRRHDDKVFVASEGYPVREVSVDDLAVRESERETDIALIRGILAQFREACSLGGMNVFIQSDVMPGSGLSSSAAYEVLLASIINDQFNNASCNALDIAKTGQRAENEYFGKPCGLMDQAICSLGGIVGIDFQDQQNPAWEQIPVSWDKSGLALCIIDTHADHANLSMEYAAIREEMSGAAKFFGKETLRQVEEDEFMASISVLRQAISDRAVIRAMHFYHENKRVKEAVDALKNSDISSFLKIINESGRSSAMYLQNIIALSDTKHDQSLALALALSDNLLKGQGAFRVHGGGFAGTTQAFVPEDILVDFVQGIDQVFGEGSCHVMSIREQGVTLKGIEL